MKKLILICASLFFVVACTSETVLYTDSCVLKDKHLCDSSAFIRVNNEEVEDLMDDVKPLIIDVRTREEYNMGHVEDSILIPISELPYRLNEIESHIDKPIFLYCRTNNRAGEAARFLKEQGYSEVYVLDTGFESIK